MEGALPWIALNSWPGIGPKYVASILSHCKGQINTLFEANPEELKILFPEVPHNVWYANRQELIAEADKQMVLAKKIEAQILYPGHKAFPSRLSFYDFLPYLLFYKGSADLNHRRTVGIIGTRDATERGKIRCEQIVKELVPFDPLIVSGLAYGIDIAAHRAALAHGLETIAVLGSGLDRIYPASHKKTATKLLAHGGLLSQFPFGAGPEREHFPMRNQIIAALSDLIIIVESKRQGGSMITAELANQLNKDVFAFPGRPDDPVSAGCNLLIKSHQAHLLESVKDIEYITRWQRTETPKEVQRQLFVDLDPDEKALLDLIRQEKQTGTDKLCYLMEWTPAKLSAVLLAIECKGLIKSLPGNQYIAI